MIAKRGWKKLLSKRILLIAVVLSVTIPLVVFPDRYVRSVFGGMELYALSVLPALFPFFFFSKILSELNFGYDLGAVMKRPLRFFFRSPPIAGYIFVMSMLCGYPVGAKLLADFYARGQLDGTQVKKIAAFTSTSGPLFVVGTVGVSMLGDKKAGFLILICHYLSAVLNGLVYGNLVGRKSRSGGELVVPAVDYGSLLGNGMSSAVASVAMVGGYVAVFNMVVDLMCDVGWVKWIGERLASVGLPLRLGEGMILSFVEVTKGCLTLSLSGFPISSVAPLVALAVTFGGVSVTLQSLTYLSKCRVPAGYFLLTKTTQGLFAFGLAKLLFAVFY